MADRPSRILDPRAAALVRVDDHLPAVPTDRLTAPALRERFAAGPLGPPELPGDGMRWRTDHPAAAAVLVALVARDDGLHVLLTQRTDHLRDHAGQISFPGGRSEAIDADATATALREAREEVGLAPEAVDVIGTLAQYTTVTNYVVTPVVALVRPGFTLKLDAFEVAESFEVPLRFLMDPANHRWHRLDIGGEARLFLAMPWMGTRAEGAPHEYFIWGATASMLRNLYAALA